MAGDRGDSAGGRRSSAVAVAAALAANLLLAAAKFVAFAFTGSASMFSEGLHSVADTFNQLSLGAGLQMARRDPDRAHPYGYGRSQWAWAVVSALGVFFVGAGISVYRGIQDLLDPGPLEHLEWALAVLALALVLEGTSFATGMRSVLRAARDEEISPLAYLRYGSDPMGVAVVLEDGVAVTGVGLAGLAVLATHLTGEPAWDGAGSIAIGLLLAASAVFLVVRNLDLLSGRSIPEPREKRIVDVLSSSPTVRSLHDVKATRLGPDKTRFKAEITFDGREIARRFLQRREDDPAERFPGDPEAVEDLLCEFADELVAEVGREIDRLEQDVREAAPEARHVDIELD